MLDSERSIRAATFGGKMLVLCTRRVGMRVALLVVVDKERASG